MHRKVVGCMTEDELRQVLKRYGWSVSRKTSHGDHYYYAVKRVKGSLTKRTEIFLCSQKKLPLLSEASIVAKLPVRQSESESE